MEYEDLIKNKRVSSDHLRVIEDYHKWKESKGSKGPYWSSKHIKEDEWRECSGLAQKISNSALYTFLRKKFFLTLLCTP